MRDEKRTIKQGKIEAAAYAILSEKGFSGTSMLSVARRARASNETLYNWYGDKIGLFRALVARNAETVERLLRAEIAKETPAMDTLGKVSPVLLGLLTGDRAIALNRAAAADPSGALGAALAEAGRDTVAPLLIAVLEAARDAGTLRFDDVGDALELYLGLLVGDMQIRRVIGQLPALSDTACRERADRATRRLQVILS